MNRQVLMLVDTDVVYDVRVRKEAETLAAAGCKVVIICRSYAGRYGKTKPFRPGINIVPAGAKWSSTTWQGSLPRLGRKLITIISMLGKATRIRADVIHAHDVDMLLPGLLLSWVKRARLVYDAHEITAEREGFAAFRWIIRGVEGLCIRCAAGVITTTDLRAEYFAGQYSIDRPLVLQNRPRFTPVRRNDYLRQTYSIPESSPVLIYQGVHQRGRGLEMLVDIASRHPEWALVLVGDGSLRKHLQQITVENGSCNIYFHDPVPAEDLPAVTASADVGIQLIENTCLNHYTTDSNKLFEYAMAGIPVIASDFPEIRKVVERYGFGLLVNPADDNAICESLVRVLGNRTLRDELQASAERARKELCWEDQEHSLVKLYHGLWKMI